jgi:hypothetical protein
VGIAVAVVVVVIAKAGIIIIVIVIAIITTPLGSQARKEAIPTTPLDKCPS